MRPKPSKQSVRPTSVARSRLPGRAAWIIRGEPAAPGRTPWASHPRPERQAMPSSSARPGPCALLAPSRCRRSASPLIGRHVDAPSRSRKDGPGGGSGGRTQDRQAGRILIRHAEEEDVDLPWRARRTIASSTSKRDERERKRSGPSSRPGRHVGTSWAAASASRRRQALDRGKDLTRRGRRWRLRSRAGRGIGKNGREPSDS